MNAVAKRLVPLLFGAWQVSCAPALPPDKVKVAPLPQAYASGRAGTSAALISWREYFEDKTLTSLIAGALENNPDLHIALQRIEVSRAVAQHRAEQRLPELHLEAGAGLSKPGRYTPEGAGNASTEIRPGRTVPAPVGSFGVGLVTSWEIDAWGKLGSLRDSAVAQYLASVEGARFVTTGLVSELATAYYELLALDRRVTVLEQTLTRQRQALEVVRLQKDAGRANELAVQQFAAQLAGTEALRAEASQSIIEVENQINVLLGRYPKGVVRDQAALNGSISKRFQAGVPADLLRNRPDVREAEQLVRAAKFDVHAARAAFYPTLNIRAGVGFEAFAPKFLFSTPESMAYSAGAGLMAPLVNKGAIEAEFQVAKATQVQALYNYQKVLLEAYADVVSGLSGLDNAKRVLELKLQQKGAVMQTVETADILYRAGKASYFEVLIAEQNTLSAELELIVATRDAHLAGVSIYKALGGGWR